MFHTLKSENGERDVLRYMTFTATPDMYLDADTGYDYHAGPEITHFVDMQGVFTMEGKEYEIKEGDIFILRPNVKHRISKVTKPGLVINMNFDLAFIVQGGDSFDLNYLNIFNDMSTTFASRLQRGNPAYKLIADGLNAIGNEFEEKKFGYAHMVKMHLFMLLLTLVRDYGYGGEQTTLLHAPHVEAIRETMRYIDDHLQEELRMETLAKIAGLSPNYYGTLFKELNGISAVSYINSKRVLRAISLLPDFNGTMLELALACGYNNTANFNRAFREFTGQVPSKYTPPMT